MNKSKENVEVRRLPLFYFVTPACFGDSLSAVICEKAQLVINTGFQQTHYIRFKLLSCLITKRSNCVIVY